MKAITDDTDDQQDQEDDKSERVENIDTATAGMHKLTCFSGAMKMSVSGNLYQFIF